MREVSLAVLDIAENSIDARATLINIDVKLSENGISFSVTDNGVGMDDNEAASAVRKGVSFKGSTGIGLALVKEDAESTGGKFEIISRKGAGTTVKAEFVGSRNAVTLGNLGATFVALTDEGYDVVLTVDNRGDIKTYDTRALKSSAAVAELQSSGALRLIREDINKNN